MAHPPLPVGELRTPDGARLAYYDTGGAGEAMVVVNGLGGPFSAWRYQVDYLRDRHRFISWDYRGLYHSKGSCPPSDVSVGQHATDLEFLLEELQLETPVTLLCWSMGVQVALEHYCRAPHQVSRLVLVNGTFGRPLDRVSVPGSRWWAPKVLERLQRVTGPGQGLMRRVTHWPETVSWLKRLGLVSPTADTDVVRSVAEEFGSVDLDVYLDTLRALGEHDATHALPKVDVPTLVIAGEKDRLTPTRYAREMAGRIARSQLLTVRGATHYTPIEYPELVNLAIEKFLREHPVDR